MIPCVLAMCLHKSWSTSVLFGTVTISGSPYTFPAQANNHHVPKEPRFLSVANERYVEANTGL